MAKTIYVVENDIMKGFGTAIVSALKTEFTDIYKFSTLSLTWVAPTALPERIDFTDSVVMLVAKDDDVAVTKESAQRLQVQALQDQIAAQFRGQIVLPPEPRGGATPDQGGLGWQNKQVLRAGNNRVALCQTGGIGSCETAKSTVLTAFAPDRKTLEEARDQRDRAKKKAAVHHDDADKVIQDADAGYAKSERHWKLASTAFSAWPQNMQEAMGKVLARLLAHEARHQYVAPHNEEGGLGGESAELIGVTSSERFLADDQKAISAQLLALEKVQKTATVHLRTFPRRNFV